MRFAVTRRLSAVPLVLLIFLSLPSELASRAPRPPRRNATAPPPCHDSSVGCPAAPGASSPPAPRCTSRCLGTVSVLGLFELTEGGRPRASGWSEVEAAKLAIHHVNSQRILGGVTLHLIVNDTKVSGTRGCGT
ncbi:hypothetical protein GE061_013300 [Apolygus lucorum]|uniref:Uncharacterized protein n=1 Tax=Apolygus lucorum TaxID=248454 RepID=A0A8S9XMK7_APOLU|nr:hypothetical protein GE061_013300 [Apolygus lucorum]